MRNLHLAPSLVAAALTLTATASGDVVISNLTAPLGTGTAFGGGATTQYKAFGFTMTGAPYTLDEVVMSLNITTTGATPQVEIYSDAGGTPGVSLIVLDNPAILAGAADYVFAAGSPLTLDANTSYWVRMVSIPMGGPAFLWDGTSPSTLPSGAAANAINYEFNGGVSSFFNRLEVRGTPGSGIGIAYCSGVPNSTGVAGALEVGGSALVSNNDVTLIASDLPANSFGFFLVSSAQGLVMNPGGSQGNLCLSGAVGRYVGPGQIQNSGSTGSFMLMIDLTLLPQPTGFVSVTAGETWNFQAWHRDAVGGMATSNFTNGVEVDFL